MVLPTTGPLTFSQIRGEFGGSAPDTLSEYYRGGTNVPDLTAGRVEIQRTGYFGSRSNVVSVGQSEMVTVGLRDDFDSGDFSSAIDLAFEGSRTIDTSGSFVDYGFDEAAGALSVLSGEPSWADRGVYNDGSLTSYRIVEWTGSFPLVVRGVTFSAVLSDNTLDRDESVTFGNYGTEANIRDNSLGVADFNEDGRFRGDLGYDHGNTSISSSDTTTQDRQATSTSPENAITFNAGDCFLAYIPGVGILTSGSGTISDLQIQIAPSQTTAYNLDIDNGTTLLRKETAEPSFDPQDFWGFFAPDASPSLGGTVPESNTYWVETSLTIIRWDGANITTTAQTGLDSIEVDGYTYYKGPAFGITGTFAIRRESTATTSTGGITGGFPVGIPAEPSTATDDYWGEIGGTTEAAADGSTSQISTYWAEGLIGTNTTILWDGEIIYNSTGLAFEYSHTDGYTYFRGSSAFSASNVFPIRRSATQTAAVQGNTEAEQSLNHLSRAVTNAYDVGTQSVSVGDVESVAEVESEGLDITITLDGSLFPIERLVFLFDLDRVSDSAGNDDVLSSTNEGEHTTPDSAFDAIIAEAVGDIPTNTVTFTKIGTTQLRLQSNDFWIMGDDTSLYIADLTGSGFVDLISSVVVNGTGSAEKVAGSDRFWNVTSGTIGSSEIQQITIDTGVSNNITDGTLVVTPNSGSNTDHSFMVTDGVPAVGSAHTTYTVTDYAEMEVTTFTRAVTSTNDSDLMTVLSMIETAIDNNEEEPLDFTAEIDSTNNRLVLTASSVGSVTGTWSISADHGSGNGNITFGDTTVFQRGINAGTNATIPTSGKIDITDFLGGDNGDTA